MFELGSLISIVRSLRFRLMLWNAFAVVLTGCAVLLSVREGVRVALLNELDSVLRQDLEEIALMMGEEPGLDWHLMTEELDRKARGHSFQGWFVRLYDAQGRPTWSSINTPQLAALSSAASSAQIVSTEGFRLVGRELPGGHARAQAVVVGSSRSFVGRDMSRIDRQVLLAGAAVLLIAPLGGYLLALRATTPVARMIETTASLRPDRLHERLEVRGAGDELDKLAITVNGMLDRIGAYLQQNHDFLANAAHELRTPLAALRSSVEVALNGQRTQEEYSELLADVIDECTSLETLVNQLLLLAETDANLLGAGNETIAFDRLVERALEMFQAVAEHQGIGLTSGPLTPVTLEGNRHHLRQLLNNLLDNAIKFTAIRYPAGKLTAVSDAPDAATNGDLPADDAEGGRIVVQLLRLDERNALELRVCDNGIGIPPEYLPHVFDRFFRVDRSRTRETAAGGTGLGLSICEAIVTAHHGKIEVRSTVGEGTTFIVTLPLGSGPAPKLAGA